MTLNGAVRRKYRGGEYAANIGTSVPVQTFYEIEFLAQSLGITKSEIVRRLILSGLAEYRQDGLLTSPAAIHLIEEKTPS